MTPQDDTRRESRGSNFLKLPPEVVGMIMKQVKDRKDHSSIRLVCRDFDKPAAKELFRDVLLSPSEEHVSTWTSISQDDDIRRIPRHAIIHTQPYLDDDDYDDDVEYEEIGEDFEDALAAISRFPNLDSVEITFTARCVGDREITWYEEVPEDPSRREEMLRLIFEAIRGRASIKENRKITKLTINNLQNCPLSDFTASDLFQDVMGGLEELHIAIIQESNKYGPDHDYTREELRTFPAHLCSKWLQPISVNLKALSIYSKSENWGPFPGYFDPSGIHFPKLETLALGYYTIAHDNDLDWVLSIKSLKTLILHNCMISSFIRIYSDNLNEWKVRKHDWTKMDDAEGNWVKSWAYNGRWSQFLDRIAESLPNLVDFRFEYGCSYGENCYGLENRHNCGVRAFPQRYLPFDNGILPTHWPEAEQDGTLYSWLDNGFPNLHKDTMEEDQMSLDRLVDKLGRSQG